MIKRKGIEVCIQVEYDNPGRVYACYFQIRCGINRQPVQRSVIPICGKERAKKYVIEQIDILADIWNLNPPKKKKTPNKH